MAAHVAYERHHHPYLAQLQWGSSLVPLPAGKRDARIVCRVHPDRLVRDEGGGTE